MSHLKRNQPSQRSSIAAACNPLATGLAIKWSQNFFSKQWFHSKFLSPWQWNHEVAFQLILNVEAFIKIWNIWKVLNSGCLYFNSASGSNTFFIWVCSQRVCTLIFQIYSERISWINTAKRKYASTWISVRFKENK